MKSQAARSIGFYRYPKSLLILVILFNFVLSYDLSFEGVWEGFGAVWENPFVQMTFSKDGWMKATCLTLTGRKVTFKVITRTSEVNWIDSFIMLWITDLKWTLLRREIKEKASQLLVWFSVIHKHFCCLDSICQSSVKWRKWCPINRIFFRCL